MNTRKEGQAGEDRAASFLEERGVKIAERNYRVKRGEIDIIGWDGDYLVFFEVKMRRAGLGPAAAQVTKNKQKIISRVCDEYRAKLGLMPDTDIRFDVLLISGDETEWIKNAFDYAGRGY